jgi:hypothetical protein
MGKGRTTRSNTEDKVSSAVGEWTMYQFKTGFGGPKYTTPTARVTKHGIMLYATEFKEKDQVSVFTNGTKVAIVHDANSRKALRKGNKAGTSVNLSSHKVVEDNNLPVGKAFDLEKIEIKGSEGYCFTL